MITYTRRGTTWDVEHMGRVGEVSRFGGRGVRWVLRIPKPAPDFGYESRYFKSRRAAFYFFEYGKRFTTNPVYVKQGQGKGKRIR